MNFFLASWNESTTELAFWVNYSNKRCIIGAALIRTYSRAALIMFCSQVGRLFEGGG